MISDNLFKLVIDDTEYVTKINRKFATRKSGKLNKSKDLYSFIPGTIREIFVIPGMNVNAGDKLLTLEAMKMKNQLLASHSGIVREIKVRADQTVAKNELLIVIE